MRRATPTAGTRLLRDPDAASAEVGRTYFPHRLTVRRGGTLATSLQSVHLGPVTVGRLTWGGEVAIDCDYPDAYEVNAPLTGALEARVAGRDVISRAGSATVFTADRTVPITRWSADSEVLGVKFDRTYLETTRALVEGRQRPGRVELPNQIDVSRGPGRAWLGLVDSIMGDPATTPLWATPTVALGLADALTAALLLSIDPDEVVVAGHPRAVRRVLEQLHADPARPWTVVAMAEVAGVGVRRLQQGFKEHVGTSPQRYLTGLRLDRAHDDLAASRGSVTEVALRWGFTHTGRFAAAYRARFGHAPSATLRG